MQLPTTSLLGSGGEVATGLEAPCRRSIDDAGKIGRRRSRTEADGLRSTQSKVPLNGSSRTAAPFDNLIDNAQRHTPRGTHIRVSLGPGSRLSVADDGPGIPVADRDRIHLRHWRGTNRRDGAAGLGLSIVTKAMQAQNGSLEIVENVTGAEIALMFAAPPSVANSSSNPNNDSTSSPIARTYS
jgi:C4-dicarboxylate-specific signal transduction histidine kinase